MLTPMDIHNKTFSKGMRGYATDEVEQFLQEVVSDYEKIYREHREMLEETDTLRTKLKNYETMETTMTSTLMMAQDTAENVKSTARKEAELIIAKAEQERDAMLRETTESLRTAREQYDRIIADVNVFRAKLRSLLESELALVEEMVPETREWVGAQPLNAQAVSPAAEEPAPEAAVEAAEAAEEAVAQEGEQ
ncbi:MAG: DivIVA domain-containing protein [Veillonellaceae bacterium]|nr:DivIVA domain-containing protein [Veillonellaceae bacterium]